MTKLHIIYITHRPTYKFLTKAFIRNKRNGSPPESDGCKKLLQSATNSFFEAKPRCADMQSCGSKPKKQRINDNDCNDGDTLRYNIMQNAAFDSD